MHRASAHHGKAWRQGLASWFLLLSILAHAVLPTGSPVQGTSGAAFSATAAEVAIAPETAEFRQTEPSGADAPGADGGGGGDQPSPLPARHHSPGEAASRPAPVAAPPSAGGSGGGAAPYSAQAPPAI